MAFISFSFAIFFAIFSVLYYTTTCLKEKALPVQRILLLFGSFLFYGYADLRFVPFLLYIIAVSYFSGKFSKNKLLFIFFLLLDILPLLFFKYSRANLIFPLGLSFYTFQSLSYIIDSFLKKIQLESKLIDVALYVSFFPTVSSGPISRGDELIPQLKVLHKFNYSNATNGMKLFAWGMFKKIVLADRIALYVNYVYGDVQNQYGLALFLATVLYSFQIYCDFSGYSDMARGVALYLGFDVDKNFNHPYFSKTIGEFWRRWHISLSSWLRDYVYIPLGGSRVAKPRIYLNLLITFFVSGIWHGAGWSFVIWGLLHGGYQCVERATKRIREKQVCPDALKVLITFCLVTFAWIFFRAENLHDAFLIIKKIFCSPFEFPLLLDLTNSVGLQKALHTVFSMVSAAGGALKGMLKIFALLAVLFIFEFKTFNKDGLELINSKKLFIRWGIYFAYFSLLVLIFYSGAVHYSSNFIYQRF